MRSIFGKIRDCAILHKRGKFMRPSGWGGGYKRTGVQVGYHKPMPLADRKELAMRLQREARA
jgi:hypothetical protein